MLIAILAFGLICEIAYLIFKHLFCNLKKYFKLYTVDSFSNNTFSLLSNIVSPCT